MKKNKNLPDRAIRDSLYYYGIAAIQVDDAEDDEVSNAFEQLYRSEDYSSYLQKRMRPVGIRAKQAPLHFNVLHALYFFPSLIRSMVQSMVGKLANISNVPVRVLWLALISLMAFPLGLFLWNGTLYSGYFYSVDILSGDKSAESSPLRLEEQSSRENSLNDNLFQELEVSSYIIEPGDTLYQLAEKFALNVDTLVSVNAIEDAVAIQYGQELFVPNRNGILHTIKKNESIASIAAKYEVKPHDILDANNVSNQVLISGEQLFIPDVTMDSFELGLVLGTIFLLPTRGVLSSGYGYRISPITGKWHFHRAIDISNDAGTRVVSAALGYVSYVNNSNPLYGRMVEITHPNGFKTLYSHLSTILVRRGQRISRGQHIGDMGNTGKSTGPHLHFAMLRYGKPVNPLRYVRF